MEKTKPQLSKVKRAGVACLNCRGRKVRCDVQVHGIPCRNCILDDVQCCVRKKKRGRPALSSVSSDRVTKKESKSTFSEGDSSLNDVPLPRHAGHAIHTVQWLPPATLEDSPDAREGEKVAQIVPFHEQTINSVPNINEENLHQQLSYTSMIDRNTLQPSQSFIDSLTPTASASSHGQSISVGYGGAESNTLPSFIKPLPISIDSSDLDYLQNKGALQIPAPCLRDEIISCYLQFIHPQLPLLDSSILRQIAQGSLSSDKAPMSILLFQAVMFSAVPFIDMQSIRNAGYDTPLDIWRAFYARVRLLYDFDIESDRMIIIQSLVLMAFMSEAPGDAKGGWHWMGITITLAMTLGLHRKADYATLDPEISRLRRRVWWSCYIRDRILALAMNRPWRIRDEEFDTPMLTLADFEIDRSETHYSEATQGTSVTTTSEEDIKMAQMSIGLAQLCALVGDILSIHFSILPEAGAPLPLRSQDGTGLTTILLFARSQITQIDRIMVCDQKLQAWFMHRPEACIYSPIGSNASILNGAFLNLVFFSMVSALHRPLLQSNILLDFVEYRMLSERRVQNAAMETSRMSDDLHRIGLSRYYPGAGALLQLPAVITFLRQLRTPSDRMQNEILSSILPCINVVEDIKEWHIGALIAVKLITTLLRRANIVLQTDNSTKRVIGLYYRNSMVAADSALPTEETWEATGEELPLPNPPGNDEEFTETGAGNVLEQQLSVNKPIYPCQEDSQQYSSFQSSGMEIQFPAGKEGIESPGPFPALVDWGLVQFAEDWWVQSPQRHLSEDRQIFHKCV